MVVIGGGAAGFFGAMSVIEHYPKARVVIIEAASHVLSKVRISGGGRCNVTHACFEVDEFIQHYPRFNRKLAHNFRQFGATETVNWFARHGMLLVAEADGRMFPTTNDSETIVKGLQREAKKRGIEVLTRTTVESIEPTHTGFRFHLSNNQFIDGSQTLMATGGNPRGYDLMRQLGHTIVEPKPSLFTFCIDDSELHALAGVSQQVVKATLTIQGLKKQPRGAVQTGPVLVTHWGFSGPAILKLSAWAARELYDAKYNALLHLDWVPHIHDEALRQRLIGFKKEHGLKQVQNWPVGGVLGDIPQRLWVYLLQRSDIYPADIGEEISHKALHILTQQLKHGLFKIAGKGVFKEEFVTSGGVSLKDIHLKTYESKITPGVFVAGELLDVDGVTGGFNFQNAWTSGYIAGQSIARAIAQQWA